MTTRKITSLVLAGALALTSVASFTGCSLFGQEEEPFKTQEMEDGPSDAITTVNVGVSRLKDSVDFQTQDIDTQTQMVLDELQRQADEGLIKPDSIHCDNENHVITFVYDSGILGVDVVDEFESDVPVNGGTKQSVGTQLLSTTSITNTDLIKGDEEYLYDGTGNRADAVILDAMTDRDWVTEWSEELATEWSAKALNTKFDDTVTLDDMASLQEYEFVFVNMHGCYCYFDYYGKNIPCVFLEQSLTDEVNQLYKDDLANLRIGYSTDNTYFITPEFFKAHYASGDLDGSIYFFGSCQLMGAWGEKCYDWPNVLSELSASAVIGYDNTVYSYYAMGCAETLVEKLLGGSTVEEALVAAEEQWGYSDNEWYEADYDGEDPKEAETACPVLSGEVSAGLAWEADPSITKVMSEVRYLADANSFYEYLSNMYNYADSYSNTLPLFYEEDDDGNLIPGSAQVWQEYAICDFDGDGEDELLIRTVENDTNNPGNTIDVLYLLELYDGCIYQICYCYLESGYEYDEDRTYFFSNGVLYDERDGNLNIYVFNDDLRIEYGLYDGDYISYVMTPDSTGQDLIITRNYCSAYGAWQSDTISSDTYYAETNALLNAGYVEPTFWQATYDGIEKAK